MKKLPSKTFKTSGVTLIELLVATGIAAIVMVSVMSTVGNIYFVQKKLRFSQNFYSESRILMERVSQFARNNTIDYDRYFLEVGPSTTTCINFDARQKIGIGSWPNNIVNRKDKAFVNGYPSIFYWDTNDIAGGGTQDRNLGGMNVGGAVDPCAQAFSGGTQPTLYLINGARTLRTTVRNKFVHETGGARIEPSVIDTDGNGKMDTAEYGVAHVDMDESFRVEIQRQLGADIDGDRVADIWGPGPSVTVDIDGDGTAETGVVTVDWDTAGECRLYVDGHFKEILGDETSDDFCAKSYDWTSISPKLMNIDHLTFHPAPDRDPFLNFRVNEAQVHPHVFISLTTNVREPNKFGYEDGDQPQMSFQTTVSSRVFGNTR